MEEFEATAGARMMSDLGQMRVRGARVIWRRPQVREAGAICARGRYAKQGSQPQVREAGQSAAETHDE